MRFITTLYTVFFCFSCKQQGETKILYFESNGFSIIDTTHLSKDFLNFDQSYTGYPIYYFGTEKDTIKIGHIYRPAKRYNFNEPQSRRYSDATLQIFVDTSTVTNTHIEYFSSSQQKIVEDSTKDYNSFLIIVKNISDSVLFMGHSTSLFFMWREAMDEQGNWVKVDKKLSELGLCLTNKPLIALAPKEIMISKLKRYKGNIITKFRIAFGKEDNVVYSNTFYDSIDKRTLAYNKERE